MTDSFQNIKNKASEFRKKGRYNEALPLYAELWNIHHDLCGKWEGWAYAICLRKTGDNKAALNICRDFYGIDKTFQVGNNLYAWCIYEDTLKQQPDEIKNNEDDFYRAAQAIIKLTSQDESSPYSKTVLKVCDFLGRPDNIFPANEILHWLNHLSPEKLSAKEYSFKDKDNKSVYIASEREKYYAHQTKVFEKQKNYQVCIDSCQEALDEIERFHYNNDIWIKRRLAISKGAIGEKQEAIDLLLNILTKKPDWFIQFDVVKLYFDIQKFDRALDFAIQAALNHGKKDSKCNLFFFMGTIYEQRKNIELAKKHFVYAYKLREANSWSIPDDLQKKIELFKIDPNSYKGIMELSKALESEWKKYIFENTNYLKGVIKHILPHGKAGFILEKQSSNSYYFSLKDVSIKSKSIRTGMSVVFLLKCGFDNKKNKETKNAYDIHELE